MADKTVLAATDDQTWWLNEISRAERREERWRNRSRKIVKKYAQQASEAQGSEAAQRQYALLWANTETIRPAMYARSPAPVVTRRYRNSDPVARTATVVMERAITYTMDAAKVHDSLLSVRDDLSLVARGTLWFRYVPTTHHEPVLDETGQPVLGEDGEPVTQEVLDDEKIVCDYVHWLDFCHGDARVWPEVPWAGRKVYLTEKELTERFGAEKAAEVQLDHRDPADKKGSTEGNAKATVYEIWSKTDNEVLFIAKSAPDILERREPMLKLDGFFPCPRPAFGTLTTDSLEPTPDYVMYQDQADEVDRLTRRIRGLLDMLKLNGFYPGGPKGEGNAAISQILQPGVEFKMIAIPDWQAFAEKGGANAIQWFPVDMVIKVVQACVQARRELIEDIYQVSGISDVMRGSTDANETLGAQQLKSQWGSSRIRAKQDEMGRFGRDCCRIIGEIVADVFDPATIMTMTDMKLPTRADLAQQALMQQQPQGPGMPAPAPAAPSPVAIEDVIELLRNDRLRGFVVDVETDSTIQPDEDAEKQRRTEFLAAVGGFLTNMGPIIQGNPNLAPMLGQFLLFGVRGFRVGRELEEIVEQTVDKVAQTAAQPPQPDPKLAAAQIKAKAEGDRAQADIQGTALRAQADQAEHEMTMRELAANHTVEMTKVAARTPQIQPVPVPVAAPQPPQVM